MRGRRLAAILLAVLLPATTVGLGRLAEVMGWVGVLEARSLDLRFKGRGVLEPEPEIVILAIDDATLRTLQLRQPLPPLLYARTLEALHQAGAAVVALDMLFSEPSRECDPPDQDSILAAAMELSGNVVVAVELSAEGRPVQPIDVIGRAAVATGFVNLPDDADNRLRRFVSFRDQTPSFASAILETYAGFVPPAWQDEAPRPINFRGPTGTYPRLSVVDVLEGRVDPRELSGRICLIGATFAAAHDEFPTPFHSQSEPDTPGVEIHANIVGNMLRGDSLHATHPAVVWLAMAGLALAIATTLARGRAWWAVGLWLASSLGWTAVAAERFLAGRLVPLAAPLLVLAATMAVGAFSSYLVERSRRREIRHLFASYVDPTVVSWMLKNPQAIDLEGQRVVATILYTDIEGFTAISEDMDPAALVSHLNRYFSAVTQAAISAGGMHDKYVGDAVMVVFGFPIRHPDHAVRAVEAARLILEAEDLLTAEWDAEGLPRLRTRIGICSGEVILGSVGGTRRKNFTAMGHAVNLAARLEGLNKRFGTRLLIAESTAAMLPQGTPLRDLGETKVRGVSKRVRVFVPEGSAEPSP